MELENSQNNALAKLPMLKLGEYEMWEIRIKQYFQIQDYALWEVIENGNSWVPIPVTAPESGPSTALKMTVPSTAEEKICKKNDVKARSLLLMALPNEHQLTFNQYVDAQSMFAAIKARFGGNEATRKTQKALLKQQYENFNASSSESLDSIFNRLQKLVSRLAILGVVTPPEDLNVKFLRSLPSEWDTHVKVKKSVGTNNDDKNLAFLTTSGASSTNTANPEVSTGNTKVNTASTEISTASFSDATVYAFLSTQPQGSQLVHEDLEQLHDDDLEEMDLKWNMAYLSMRQKNVSMPLKWDNLPENAEHQRSKGQQKLESSDMAKEEIQANMALMAFSDSEVREKEGLSLRIAKVCKNIKDLDQLLASQITDKSKKGLEEFKQPEVNEYGSRDSSVKPTTGCDKEEEEPKKARENTDAPIIEDWVSDDEDDVESIPKVKKKTVIPTATKKEFVKPEKPVRRSVSFDHIQYSCPNVHKHMVPRAVLMKTGLKTINIARPINTARSVNTGKPFSTARTPQQNGVAERNNRTLIEAARTMLADSKLPTIFWAKAVSTACYVQNRVLIVKPHKRLLWNSCRGIQGVSESSTSSQQDQDWIAMPIWKDASYFGDASPKIVDDAQIEDKDELHDEDDATEESHDGSNLKENGTADQQVNTARPDINTGSREVSTALPEVNTATPEDLVGPSPASEDSHVEDQEIELGNIPQSYEVPTTPHTRIHKDHPIEHVIGDVQSSVQTRRMKTSYSEKGFLRRTKKSSQALRDPAWVEAMQEELLQFKLQKVWILVDLPKGHRAIGHNQEEGIDYDEVFAPVARIKTIRLFLAYASYMGFMVYQMDVKSAFLYGQIEEDHPELDDIIFGSTKNELCDEFKKLMKDKFQMSSMGELTFFLGLRVQQRKKGIFINRDADDVDEHLYRSMIRYLMYLTASRPDIMFAVCACARFQVSPKTSHLLAVKRIFRYLKGKPSLGLWYSKDSPLELVAYNDSDYAGATLDRKSTY
ncbi:putative ribonuclease H-like domain-containing protein [Tanacetum coccineum]